MSIRIGTTSPTAEPTKSAALLRLAEIARRAAEESIDILLLPEAFVGGYPRGQSFGCVIGERSRRGRDEFVEYFAGAVDFGDTVENGAGAGSRWINRELGSPDTMRGDGTRERLEKIASDTGVFLVVGCVEKAGGSLYCSVVYVCPNNGVLGKRRKVMPTAAERLVWAQGCPSTLRAVSTYIRGIRVNMAAAICWENYMPLLRQSLYSQNVNLYLAPTADGRDSWLSLIRTIGIEGRCFVMSSNMCSKASNLGTHETTDFLGSPGKSMARIGSSAITDEGFEIALPCSPKQKAHRKSVLDANGNDIILSRDAERKLIKADDADNAFSTTSKSDTPIQGGGSCIVSPFGDVLEGPQWDDESIIYTDVDLQDCIRGRLDLDTGGSYSRGDSFNLSVRGLNMDPLPY